MKNCSKISKETILFFVNEKKHRELYYQLRKLVGSEIEKNFQA